jgi:uncharacterized protein (DUF1501 family)
MKRRNFLKIFPSAATVTPFVVNGFPIRPFANSKMAKMLSACEGIEERVLVLIQLKGGNDGVNNIIPINQYDRYAALRPSVKIEQNQLVNLDTTLSGERQVGLHPALTPFKALYEKGWMSLVQGVGYQAMNQSHFKGTDIWLSGGDTTTAGISIGSGWMGRSLQTMYPEVLGAPTPDMPDPLGIQIGDSNPSLGFHTESEHQNVINLSGQDPAGFYSLVQTIGGAPVLNVPDSDHGDELSYIMSVERSVNKYAERISKVFNTGKNSITTYPVSSLANQLKTVARLINGGCKTKVYLCQTGGYDTHSSQVQGGATTTGSHAELLANLANSVKAFFDDLEGLGIADQVAGCTFSEFGRCAKENGSTGTDHGTLAPLYVFGKNIKAGVNGNNVNLSNLTQDNQLQGVQFDYRQIFSALLQDWLGADNPALDSAMFDGFAKMPLIDTAFVVKPECYIGSPNTSVFDPSGASNPMMLFPNPASVSAEITFESAANFDARLTVHSMGGSLAFASNVRAQTGTNLFHIDVASIPAGNYVVRLENKANGAAEVARLSVVR